jgi:uncharacterized repeat protein (TIGR03833 family)
MMQRPRNRQSRPPQSDRVRGRGRGRGGFNVPDRNEYSNNVPNITRVVAGAFVSIVLKIDQPTGKEVQGVVADVLTNGNHPRGIKVRLVDGRVGRVQRMVSEETARAGSESLSGLGRNGEVGSQFGPLDTLRPPRFTRRYHDVREEEELVTPSAGYSLEDFLPLGHALREDPPLLESKPASSQTCPVCGDFNGDEEAVSYHVGKHFD